jgi:replication-associated recombination protein RarA
MTDFFENDSEQKMKKEEESRKEHTLWCERYRPLNLDSFVGNELVKEKAKQYINENDIPHILLHGRPGGGKCLDFSEKIDIRIELNEEEEELLKKWKNNE